VIKLNKSEEANAPIPAPATLSTWSAEKWQNGIQVNELNELDTLSVETMNHTYEVTVINPPTAEVLIRGGEFFPHRRLAHISGASLGGSFLKVHGIYVGFKLELIVAGRRIITSPVRAISVLESYDSTEYARVRR
jgi:hypothetical protein